MKFSLIRNVCLSLSSFLLLPCLNAEEGSLILILSSPDLGTPPPHYTLLKTLSATAELPTQIHSPLDNPALKIMIEEAKTIHASALLGLNCQTNGHSIACSSTALSHDFSLPSTNNFDETTQQLFGNGFYNDPLHYPSYTQLGQSLSVTFYLNPAQYRQVSGESVEENTAWWGLKKESITVKKPEIPALCIDALAFLKMLNADHAGIVNFNCFASTSALPGYIQVNASANTVLNPR